MSWAPGRMKRLDQAKHFRIWPDGGHLSRAVFTVQSSCSSCRVICQTKRPSHLSADMFWNLRPKHMGPQQRMQNLLAHLTVSSMESFDIKGCYRGVFGLCKVAPTCCSKWLPPQLGFPEILKITVVLLLLMVVPSAKFAFDTFSCACAWPSWWPRAFEDPIRLTKVFLRRLPPSLCSPEVSGGKQPRNVAAWFLPCSKRGEKDQRSSDEESKALQSVVCVLGPCLHPSHCNWHAQGTIFFHIVDFGTH